MKRWICMLLAVTLLLGLCACGAKTPAEDNQPTDGTTTTTTMYWDFIKATGKYVTVNPNISGTIPCITSIQNVRSSWMGDTFNEPGNYDPNADGYHLNDKGDLVAAMTWVAYFTGKSATEFKIATKYSDAQYAAFAEAVDNAIKKPLQITQSSYTTEP